MRVRARFPLVVSPLLLAAASFAAEDPDDPWVDRFEPLGGQQGATVAVEIVGRNLAPPPAVAFDSPHLVWEDGEAISDSKITGRIRIDSRAAPGPHIATLLTAAGRANSGCFTSMSFPRHTKPSPTT